MHAPLFNLVTPQETSLARSLRGADAHVYGGQDSGLHGSLNRASPDGKVIRCLLGGEQLGYLFWCDEGQFRLRDFLDPIPLPVDDGRADGAAYEVIEDFLSPQHDACRRAAAPENLSGLIGCDAPNWWGGVGLSVLGAVPRFHFEDFVRIDDTGDIKIMLTTYPRQLALNKVRLDHNNRTCAQNADHVLQVEVYSWNGHPSLLKHSYYKRFMTKSQQKFKCIFIVP